MEYSYSNLGKKKGLGTVMSELTIRAFLNYGGKLKKEKADDKTMSDVERCLGKLATSSVDKKLGKSIIKSIKDSFNKEKKNER